MRRTKGNVNVHYERLENHSVTQGTGKHSPPNSGLSLSCSDIVEQRGQQTLPGGPEGRPRRFRRNPRFVETACTE